MAHEILYNLDLSHPYQDEQGYKIYKEKTDNLMDYVEGNESTVEKRYRASSLWKWQYEMAREIGAEQYKGRIEEYRYEAK